MIELAAIEAARERIADVAVRTPLIRLRLDDAPAEIYLKLENLQPINSFKIRGATNAVRSASPEARARSDSGALRIALAAPRILNELIGCRFSSFR